MFPPNTSPFPPNPQKSLRNVVSSGPNGESPVHVFDEGLVY